jgi:two-component system, OmpR family, sensor kinase
MGALARAANEAERNAAMENLSAGVQRAIRLVEQMLSFARQGPRAEPGRVGVPLTDIVREVVAELVPFADAKHIDLGISNSESAVVMGDPDALRTLTRNLVDNAVRYTPDGGRVDVFVEHRSPAAAIQTWSERAAATLPAHIMAPRVVLRVVDDGPGIPPEERTRVLDRFYRRPGTSPPGSGLGMAIVKAIADTHGATLKLDTGPNGHGLGVSVLFPATPSPVSEPVKSTT